MTITLTVSGRIATVDATTHVVAGNTYPVTLSLDSEWTGSLYLRVRFGSLYYDIPFASSDTSVDVQMPVGYPEVGIGVFSEALQICSCEARIRLLRSILEAGEQVVEFDSDLYDQWAGEVSELLCDDAFDSTSDRPVKNSVLTAWKGQVENGTMTINGSKTFTGPFVVTSSNPTFEGGAGFNNLDLYSKGQYNGFRARSRASSGTGYDTLFEIKTVYASRTQHNMQVASYTPRTVVGDESESQSKMFFELNALSNGTGAVKIGYTKGNGESSSNNLATFTNDVMAYHSPSFTANNNADTIIVNRAMLASTPTIVHTSGIETIAGAKTFTSLLTASNVAVKDASTPTITMLKGSTEVASIASDEAQAGITASSQFFGLRGLGTAPFGQSPSYTADNGADNKIVNRAMLASTPTIVHTTGNETVAGVKTFSNQPVFASGVGRSFTLPSSTDVPIARIHLAPSRWTWNASMSFVVSGINFLALCTVRRRQYNGVPIFEVHTLSVNPSWNNYKVVMDESGDNTDGADITIGLRSEDTSTAVLKVSNINVFAPGTSDYTPEIPDSWTPGANRQEWVIE